ncbi:MAG: glycosyltransferase family 2 protein [Candidatus Omnitrophica bacterium]|nr:glycosyltransferase family 2 protein [Candidatus Omnitrophota bacterium]
MSSEIKVSFITPVYNEELNIARMLKNLYQILSEHPDWNWELILIEDGSKDGTRRVLTEEVKKYPKTHLILHDQNQGYTRSLKDGITKARGNFLMYIGADEEFDCAEIPAFIEPLLSGETDLVLGVRWQRNAYQLFRFFLSVIYIFLLNYLFKLRINDYNWSQAWSKKFLDRVDLRSKSLFVLPEMIIKAHDLKYRIKEVPSNHRGRQAGKSSVNLRIMGFALWEAIMFWKYRNSKQYQPAARDTYHGASSPQSTIAIQN